MTPTAGPSHRLVSRGALGDRANGIPAASSGRAGFGHPCPPRRRSRSEKLAAAQEKLDAEATELQGLIEQSASAEIVVHGVLGLGSAAAEVARLARDADAEVVVVGRRGAGRMKDLLLGTTAEHIAQLATVPVVIAGGSPTGVLEPVRQLRHQSCLARAAVR